MSQLCSPLHSPLFALHSPNVHLPRLRTLFSLPSSLLHLLLLKSPVSVRSVQSAVGCACVCVWRHQFCPFCLAANRGARNVRAGATSAQAGHHQDSVETTRPSGMHMLGCMNLMPTIDAGPRGWKKGGPARRRQQALRQAGRPEAPARRNPLFALPPIGRPSIRAVVREEAR